MKGAMITCMLLKRLKVLLQTEQENWVGPMRIWAGEGIQYWPGTWPGLEINGSGLFPRPPPLVVVAAGGGGRPIWSATVTPRSDELGFWWWRRWWWWWCCKETTSFEEVVVVTVVGLSLCECWPGGPREREMESSSSSRRSWWCSCCCSCDWCRHDEVEK